MEKTLANVQYDYNSQEMVVTFQTKTALGGGQFEYGSYDATISDSNDKSTILAIINAL